jgi:hypothetical protein
MTTGGVRSRKSVGALAEHAMYTVQARRKGWVERMELCGSQ